MMKRSVCTLTPTRSHLWCSLLLLLCLDVRIFHASAERLEVAIPVSNKLTPDEGGFDDGLSGEDAFGETLARDGDVFVVSAPGDGNRDLGAVYVFTRTMMDGGTKSWTKQKLQVPGRSEWDEANWFDSLGSSLAIEGDYLIAGCLACDGTDANGMSLPKSGAVFVFKRQSDGLWEFDDRLEASDADILDYFGSATAIHGERIAVGASNKNGADAEGNPVRQVGAAYVFVRKNGAWVEEAKFSTTVDAKPNLQFGKEVAIYDDTLVVSADRQGEDAAGKVYVYTRGLDSSWAVEAELTEPESDGNRFRTFGVALAYDGNFLAVSSTGLAFRGVVWIFKRTTTNDGVATWSETQKLEASDGLELDYFGSALAFTENILIVGMDADDVDGKQNSGSVYIFRHVEDESWLEIAKLTAGDAENNDFFGNAVAASVSDQEILIGAVGKENGTGAAYTFDLEKLGGFPQPVPSVPPTTAPTAAPSMMETAAPSTMETASPSVTPTAVQPPICELEFILYNADEDKPLHTLKETECIEPFKFNIQAQPTEGCLVSASAQMELSGPRNFVRTENKAPFFIFGDKAGDINGRGYIAGDYQISASLYSELRGDGELVAQREFSFTMSGTCDGRRYLRAGHNMDQPI